MKYWSTDSMLIFQHRETFVIRITRKSCFFSTTCIVIFEQVQTSNYTIVCYLFRKISSKFYQNKYLQKIMFLFIINIPCDIIASWTTLRRRNGIVHLKSELLDKKWAFKLTARFLLLFNCILTILLKCIDRYFWIATYSSLQFLPG